MDKSTVDEIRRRFDADVERFSDLSTGQSATIDAPLVLDLITTCAAGTTPNAQNILDIGCGAGNYTLKLLEKLPARHATLIDLSRPMLDRATQRVTAAGAASVTAIQGDIREIPLAAESIDIIMAAAVLHHLRETNEWESVFRKLHECLRPGGSVWISDMVSQATLAVHELMWQRYGDYLTTLKNAKYRDEVFTYVEHEDTPRPLTFQLDLLRRVGFAHVEVLHKNGPFAAFGAVKE